MICVSISCSIVRTYNKQTKSVKRDLIVFWFFCNLSMKNLHKIWSHYEDCSVQCFMVIGINMRHCITLIFKLGNSEQPYTSLFTDPVTLKLLWLINRVLLSIIHCTLSSNTLPPHPSFSGPVREYKHSMIYVVE